MEAKRFVTKREKPDIQIDLIDQYIDGNAIVVPIQLIADLNQSSFGRKGKELTCLQYDLVRKLVQHKEDKKAAIHHKAFFFGTSYDTAYNTRRWLLEKRYIETDGHARSYTTNPKCQKYWLNYSGRNTALKLCQLCPNYSFIQDDCPICDKTAQLFRYLTFNKEEIKSQLKLEAKGLSDKEIRKRLRRHISKISDIVNNSGCFRRSKKGGRLYTPIVNLKKSYRRFFSFDNMPMVNIDMTNAHPTLLANLAGDEKMLTDCLVNKFYNTMPCFESEGREAAKNQYYYVAFGNIRNNCQITDTFARNYPRAFEFMNDYKLNKDYRKFSHMLQKKESNIWIDGILAQLFDKNIKALSFHDSIYTAVDNQELVNKVIDKVMQENNIQYKICYEHY